MADCPREGTNEIPIQVYEPASRTLVPVTAHLCDHDFHAVHDAVIGFAFGEPQAE